MGQKMKKVLTWAKEHKEELAMGGIIGTGVGAIGVIAATRLGFSDLTYLFKVRKLHKSIIASNSEDYINQITDFSKWGNGSKVAFGSATQLTKEGLKEYLERNLAQTPDDNSFAIMLQTVKKE